MLEGLESTATRATELQAPVEVDATPAVLQMTTGLREYASLATA
jgi:hypothetical protein